MTELREASAVDRDAILDLRARCFPADDPEKRDPRFWDWEFLQSPYGAARIFVAEERGSLLAHFALVPWYGSRAPLAVDAMTAPEARRRGIFRRLVAYARRTVERDFDISGAFQIRKPVLNAMTSNGWRHERYAHVLVKPLALSVARSRRRTDVTQPAPSTAFFAWRYQQNPLWQYTVAADGNGHIVTRRTTLKGYDTLAVVDLGGRPHELLREALARARGDRITLAAALVTYRHPALPLLLRFGFLPGPHRFRFLVNRFAKDAEVARAMMWGDTDHL